MDMPGFTAERSLYKSRFAYRETAVYVQASSGTVSPAYLDIRDRHLFPLGPEPGPGEMPQCYCYTAYCDCKRGCEVAFGLCMQAAIVSALLTDPIAIVGSYETCKRIRKYCKDACKEIFGEDIKVECIYPPGEEPPTVTPPSPSELEECWNRCKRLLTGEQLERCLEKCGGI